MKQSINQSQFIDAFRDYGREDNFSYPGLCALYDWIEELDESCGTETELAETYGYLFEDDMPETMEEWCDKLNDHTMVIQIDGSNIIIQDF